MGTHNGVIGDTVGLGPAGHDESVVESNDDNQVNTLGLELVDVLGVGGDVRARAGGGESTGDGDENDLLGLELCSMGAGHVNSCSFNRRCHSRRVGLQETQGRGDSRTVAGSKGNGGAALRELSDLGGGRDVAEEDALGEVVASLESTSESHLECGLWWCFGRVLWNGAVEVGDGENIRYA